MGELSFRDMFLHADLVVQGVMLLLLLASMISWVIIVEKTLVLRRFSQVIQLFYIISTRWGNNLSVEAFPGFAKTIVEVGLAESADRAGRESRADFRERVERAMKMVLSRFMDRLGGRSAFLATVGASSPFVGLFGTVWGIMHSFKDIAASGETTLAVVAPGIAEALLATAIGLAAAIPAVVAYNKINITLKKITSEAMAGIGLVGNALARRHFRGLEGLGDKRAGYGAIKL